ncbi:MULTISPECIES: cell division protein ZapA [Bacillaceae]|uniref:Cell division protein ZapA n=1 Tax=Evansella alkalicola TaxID=745819 RepID=A0ABS6JSY4_9BACI|nr:cell division protein ZapA [Litchfieldia alkalitelluris]MBU9721186.1 cell division protein ZapA [Bacillus alkalicola]
MEEGQGKSRTIVSIYGQQYTIVGSENPEHVKAVAKFIDQKMRDIKTNNPYLDTNKLAVLTAVNIGNEYLSLLEALEKEKKDED